MGAYRVGLGCATCLRGGSCCRTASALLEELGGRVHYRAYMYDDCGMHGGYAPCVGTLQRVCGTTHQVIRAPTVAVGMGLGFSWTPRKVARVFIHGCQLLFEPLRVLEPNGKER